MAMLPLEKELATHVYWACGDWPIESKRNLCEAIQAALKEQRGTEREECAKAADAEADAMNQQMEKYPEGSVTWDGLLMRYLSARRVADAIRSRTEGEGK